MLYFLKRVVQENSCCKKRFRFYPLIYIDLQDSVKFLTDKLIVKAGRG